MKQQAYTQTHGGLLDEASVKTEQTATGSDDRNLTLSERSREERSLSLLKMVDPNLLLTLL